MRKYESIMTYFCMFPKRLELDFPVAENVRIGRFAVLVANEECGKHVIPVLGDKIDMVRLDVQRSG